MRCVVVTTVSLVRACLTAARLCLGPAVIERSPPRFAVRSALLCDYTSIRLRMFGCGSLASRVCSRRWNTSQPCSALGALLLPLLASSPPSATSWPFVLSLTANVRRCSSYSYRVSSKTRLSTMRAASSRSALALLPLELAHPFSAVHLPLLSCSDSGSTITHMPGKPI